jgi:hypothetical protein
MAVFFTGLAAFIGGALISWVNYLLLRRLIAGKGQTGMSLASPVRMLLSAVYFLLLFFLGSKTDLNAAALLIGGALGLTAALAFFTLRLARSVDGKGKE